ncbi:hypothetical protein E2P81_ATG10956 [Venturia nashicola]|uniref:Uncharacterized protein n=1 Tax=Venturia nashicola TaxID=86259 RepID=A0A4Z1NPR7_9PEZI|nr:hypothetical protein E6O75_ATG10631 [Venturia nashicola]TLD27668.1 hypothetical protein E2P81_ATG10956 [Venturia nashicola]
MISQLFTTLFILPTTLASVISINTAAEGPCDFSAFSKLAFNTSVPDWYKTFTSNTRPSCFEWCSDACSSSPDSYPATKDGGKVSFKPVCARHDFSYRNLKRLGQFNEVNKKTADKKLRDGMVEACGRHENCVEAAKYIYYPIVRMYNWPEAEHNKWDGDEGKGNTKCSVFPGCCANHEDPKPCGREDPLPGQHKGDSTCMAR